MARTDLPILEQRRIEANIIKPIYEEMVTRLGRQQAGEILRTAITRDSIQQGQAYAENADGVRQVLKASTRCCRNGKPTVRSRLKCSRKAIPRCITTSPAANTQKCIVRWGLQKSVTYCPAAAMEHFAPAMTRRSNWIARRRSCRAQNIAISAIAGKMRDEQPHRNHWPAGSALSGTLERRDDQERNPADQ